MFDSFGGSGMGELTVIVMVVLLILGLRALHDPHGCHSLRPLPPWSPRERALNRLQMIAISMWKATALNKTVSAARRFRAAWSAYTM